MEVHASKADPALPRHRHLSGQVAMALSGTFACDIEGQLHMAAPGAAIWIPPGLTHTNRFDMDGSACFMYLKDGIAGLPAEPCTLVIHELLGELIKDLARRPVEYEPDSLQSRLISVTLELLRAAPVKRWTVPVPKDRRLRMLMDEILACPRVRGSAADFAVRLGMSERTFTRRVQQDVGMSFCRWRQQLHLMLAVQWLRQGASVQRVADDLGYESVTGFILMFRKVLGKPPAQYVAYQRA